MSANEARGFLDHILANPDDDAPRLVFADWLEEHGDADRAEFIRVQIERTRLPEWDARQVKLGLREHALRELHAEEWVAQLPHIAGITWCGFRRGFVAKASFAGCTALREKVNACWMAAPVESIFLPWPRSRDTVNTIPAIPGLRELTLSGRAVGRSDVLHLAASPLLSTLHALNIGNGSLGMEGFHQLLESPHLGNLKALRASRNSIGNGGISSLLEATSITSLEELDLSEEDNYGRYGEDPIVTAAGIEELLTWPGMPHMRSLNLSGSSIGREGLRALLRSPRTTGLKKLILRNNGLLGSHMQEFAAAHADLQLDVLDLSYNLLSDEGAAELAFAPCLRELKVLTLDYCEIELAGARRLAKAPFLGSLRILEVNSHSFGADGVKALCKAMPPQLHTLRMANNDLGNEGVAHLASSPASNTLLELDLVVNGLDFQAMQALAKSEHLRNLLILRLSGNPIDKLAVETFSASALGKRLAILEFYPPPSDEDIPF